MGIGPKERTSGHLYQVLEVPLRPGMDALPAGSCRGSDSTQG